VSRFGIRKRIRSMLGSSDRPEIVTYPVTFILPDGTEQTLEVEERYNLLMASQGLPAPISNGRRAGGPCPDGSCDLCRVEILDPTGLSEMKPFEEKVMMDHTEGKPHEGRPRAPVPAPGPKTRLACHCKIIGPGGRIKVHALVDFDALQGESDGT
jgi:ferredoxin